MQTIMDNLVIIIPYFIVELTLAVCAIVHIVKHPHYRFGNKILWIIICAFIQIIGPVCYFVFGRGEEE